MLKYLFIGLLSFFSIPAYAFTLLTSDALSFGVEEVVVNYDSSSCPSTRNLKDILESAFADGWNAVPFAGMKLTIGSDISGVGLETDKIRVLCDDTLATGILGVGGFTSTGSQIAAGSLRINSSAFSDLSLTNLKLTIIHELGHAIGIGHSEEEAAVMYFSLNGSLEKLHQDDYDAMTYLYPRKEPADGVMGCGTIANLPPQDPTPFLLMLFSICLLSLIVSRFASAASSREAI